MNKDIFMKMWVDLMDEVSKIALKDKLDTKMQYESETASTILSEMIDIQAYYFTSEDKE